MNKNERNAITKPQSYYKPQGICFTQFVINFDTDDKGELICRDFRTLGDGCKGVISILNHTISGKYAKDVSKELYEMGICKNNTSCAIELAKAIDEAVLVNSGVDISQMPSKRKPPITNVLPSAKK